MIKLKKQIQIPLRPIGWIGLREMSYQYRNITEWLNGDMVNKGRLIAWVNNQLFARGSKLKFLAGIAFITYLIVGIQVLNGLYR